MQVTPHSSLDPPYGCWFYVSPSAPRFLPWWYCTGSQWSAPGE